METAEKLSDEHFVKLLRQGDERALESIYRRYARVLFRYTQRKIHAREEVEEIIQEVFIWLWENRTKLENITSLKSYLFAAARHRLVNYIRSSRIRQHYAEDRSHFTSQENNTQEQLDLLETQTNLEKSLAALPERCRIAFCYSRLENLSINEIAEKMAISTRTVENYITRALKHLRTYWRHSQTEY